MKAIPMINGMMQLIGMLGSDVKEIDVVIEIKTESGAIVKAPLKQVTFSSQNDKEIVLTNIPKEQ